MNTSAYSSDAVGLYLGNNLQLVVSKDGKG